MERSAYISKNIGILPNYGEDAYERLRERPWIQHALTEIEQHHPDTQRHSFGVFYIVSDLAKKLSLPKAERKLLQDAALVHDWGKKVVPVHLIEKKGNLLESEKKSFEAHVDAGVRYVSVFNSEIAQIVGYHHCFQSDKPPYPQDKVEQLAKMPRDSKVFRLAQILAVADQVEAMHSLRPYAGRRGIDYIKNQLLSQRFITNPSEPIFSEKLIDDAISAHQAYNQALSELKNK